MYTFRFSSRLIIEKVIRAACASNFPIPLRTRISAARGGTLDKIALVAPDLSFVYVPIPKAANSTIKHALLALYGHEISEPHHQTLHTNLEPYQPISRLSSDELQLAFRNSQVYRFTFVRNPYARLQSAYQDKIADYNGRGYGDHYSKKLLLTPGATFEQFVHRVAAQPDRASDWHWMSQTRCAMLDFIHYSFIGHVETLVDDMHTVFEKISPNACSQNSISRLNRTHKPFYKNVYTERLAEIMCHRYRADFDNFKYDPASWKNI